jgi:hypothetical protein
LEQEAHGIYGADACLPQDCSSRLEDSGPDRSRSCSTGELDVTTLRTVAVHEVVARTHPRPPPTDRDEIAMAAGRAIDGALSGFAYAFRQRQRPTATAMFDFGTRLLDEALDEAAVEVAPAERERILGQMREVLQAYRKSEIFGLLRPKSRVIVIDHRVGVYAQPDYWDGAGRIYEMKSYLAIPPSAEVTLQLHLFQLAFPKQEATLICIDRHARPVATSRLPLSPLSLEEAERCLRLAYEVGLEFGQEKVLEYMEGPFVDYSLAPAPK